MARNRDAGKGFNERPMSVSKEEFDANHADIFGKDSGPDRFKNCRPSKPESEKTDDEKFRDTLRRLAPPV